MGDSLNVLTSLCVINMYVLLTKHPGNTVQYMPERRSREDMYRARYCPGAQSITLLLHAQLGYQHFFHSIFFCSTQGQSPVHIV